MTDRSPPMPWRWEDCSKDPKYQQWRPTDNSFIDSHDRRSRLLMVTCIERSFQIKVLEQIFNLQNTHDAVFERLADSNWWKSHFWIKADQKPSLSEPMEVNFCICEAADAMPSGYHSLNKKGIIVESNRVGYAIFVRSNLDTHLNGQRRKIVAVMKQNLRPIDEQIKALDQVDHAPVFGDMDPERRKEVFGGNATNVAQGADYFELNIEAMSELPADEKRKRLEWIAKSFPLDAYQSEAFRRSTTAIPGGVHLIKGPPGTGKTSTALVIILSLAALGIKVLVSAGSNKAVDNLTYAIYKALQKHQQLQVWCGTFCRFRTPSYQIAVIRKDSATQQPIRRQGALSDVEEVISICQADSLVWSYVDSHCRDNTKCQDFKDLVALDRKDGLRIEEALKLKDIYEDLMGMVLEDCRVVATTLSTASEETLRLRFKPGYLICDESGQCVEGDHMIAMTMESIRAVTLIGDSNELPPTVASERRSTNEGALYLKRSLMTRLDEAGYPMSTLNISHRANSAILNWYNKTVYKDQLIPGPDNDKPERVGNAWDAFTTSRHHFHDKGLAKVRRLFISVTGRASQEKNSTSWHNQSQAEVAAQLHELYQGTTSGDKIKAEDVMILSPYRAQCQTVKKILGGPGGYYLMTKPGDQERNIGLIGDEQHLNVAMSRAMKVLVIIGNLGVWNRGSAKELSKRTHHKTLSRLLFDVMDKNHVLTWAGSRTVTETGPSMGYRYRSHIPGQRVSIAAANTQIESRLTDRMDVDDDDGCNHPVLASLPMRPTRVPLPLPLFPSRQERRRSLSPLRPSQPDHVAPSVRERSPRDELEDRVASLTRSLRHAAEDRRMKELELQLAKMKEDRLAEGLQEAKEQLRNRQN
ncbi:hypothetical protein ASPZODRAFT_21166 [Penicilliopsis zonata CBS 506.65]|uniref:DNA2/NAM7 helicase-like C-terminal domain-containing protein n=1 Tax=Penicilliopsis zonata CBS 506.65 TaxID=1073090 RepID=A0A1L9SU67_9EURO|nr:hypothetical protein ASPZODRAFT_21166 [Penicilliopsis zonata CBS 506.65]OJJ50613.1 hypothetical protein ASPZODRAFT_21166 [Penicilliopsis zonata CBS 506.65]